MIYCRSPFYKSIPWLRPSDSQQADSFTLELFVYVGDKTADLPGTAQYSKTIYNVENSTGTIKTDIANLISDFIPDGVVTSLITEVLDGNNTVWVKHQVKYLVGADETTELVVTELATNGYSYGLEGENYQTTKEILTDTTEIDAYKQSFVQVPLLLSDSSKKLLVKSYPSSIELINTDLAATDESTERISILNIKCKDADEQDRIEVTFNGESFNIFLRDECKDTPQDVAFLNRYGHLQTMTFFKKRVNRSSVEGESYMTRDLQPSAGYHQFKTFNKNGRGSFELSTGYIEESANTLVKELLHSERIWISGVPVNLDTNSITYKTRNNDKNISYKMNFKNSYTEINSI